MSSSLHPISRAHSRVAQSAGVAGSPSRLPTGMGAAERCGRSRRAVESDEGQHVQASQGLGPRGQVLGFVGSLGDSPAQGWFCLLYTSAQFIRRAVHQRERPLRRTAEIPYGRAVLTLTPEASAEIVTAARRRSGTHNVRRRVVETLLWEHLAGQLERRAEANAASSGGDIEICLLYTSRCV